MTRPASSLRELAMGVARLAAGVLVCLRAPTLPGEVDQRAYNRSAPGQGSAAAVPITESLGSRFVPLVVCHASRYSLPGSATASFTVSSPANSSQPTWASRSMPGDEASDAPARLGEIRGFRLPAVALRSQASVALELASRPRVSLQERRVSLLSRGSVCPTSGNPEIPHVESTGIP